MKVWVPGEERPAQRRVEQREPTWNPVVELIRRMGAPMRPHPSETQIVERWALEGSAAPDPLEVLVLGVTPETVAIPWPAHVHLTAADESEMMIRAFWPGDSNPRRRRIRANWFDLPARGERYDVVLGDGVFNVSTFPDGYAKLCDTVHELLRPGGRFVVRTMLQAPEREHPADVVRRFRQGELRDYHRLRFRLVTSLQGSTASGLAVSRDLLDQTLIAYGIDLGELYRETGYTPPACAATAQAIVRSSYPSLAELTAVLGSHFELIDQAHGSHPESHRCPILMCRRRRTPSICA